MGLVIKDGNLAYIYNLGGENVEISLSSKPVNTWPAIFNLVKVERYAIRTFYTPNQGHWEEGGQLGHFLPILADPPPPFQKP